VKSLSLNLLLLGAVAWANSAVAQVDVSIGSETVSAGGVATVSLDVSGLGKGTALGAFDLNVGFNSSIVSFASASYGDPVSGDQLNLEGFGTYTNTTPGNGTTELTELSFDSSAALLSSQATSFTLATLSFDALTAGSSALTLSVNGLESGPVDQNGNAVATTFQDGAITVSGSGGGTIQAPEIDSASAMSALALLLGGLAVVRGRRVVNA
jgi:hypothetical protein